MHIKKISYRYLPHFRKNFEMPKKNPTPDTPYIFHINISYI